MAIRKIVTIGDPILEKVCRPVTDFNDRLFMLLDDMRDTLAAAHGAGLAGPQVGVLRRVALVMVEDESYLEIINPEIIDRQGEQEDIEGCLSVPGQYGTVVRPQKVVVRYQDRHGEQHEREAEGFTARAFCHEIDHLDGHLYTELAIDFVTEEELNEGEDE